jgi:peptidoglycan hydrolase-like protein with peptidoglycan-binding domain
MPVVKQGSSGPDVKDLQQKLKDLGFDPNSTDGTFGRHGAQRRMSR